MATEKKVQKSQGTINYPDAKIGDVLAAFWRGVKPLKWFLFVLILASVVSNLASIIIPLFYKQFFDIVSVGGNKTALAGQLFVLIIYVLIFNLIGWFFYRISDFINNKFEPEVMANLRQQSYNYLMLHSYSFFANNFAGSLVQKVNRFARAFERITDDMVGSILPLCVRVVAILFVVFFINRWIDLVLFIWTVVFLGFNLIFSAWKVKYDINVAAIDSKATGYLADTIGNQNSIQLFNGFSFESDAYKNVTNEQAKISKFSWNLSSVLYAVQGLLGAAIEFFLFYYAVKYWQQGLITVGVFVLLQAYILNIIDQVWGFSRIIRDVYQSYADAKEMVEILLLPHEIKDIPTAKELFADRGEIEFKNLNFSFFKEAASAEASSGQARKVLENINLVIRPGEKVALVGPSGAGKTTFVRLLLRFYSPTSGAILIDGQNIGEVTQESLRKNISMVPQEPVLFHRTLSENIGYGKRGSSFEEIKKASEAAHCDEFIKGLPLGFDTFVGERGIKLSGGERQRVAIARAILKNAPVLILDEATSSLDSNSEMLIQDALNNLMQNKTVIVIAHRLSTIQKMDRIIVVDGGKIIEQGSHRELLSKESSLYKKLWELQAGGFLESEKDEETKEELSDDDEEKTINEAKFSNF